MRAICCAIIALYLLYHAKLTAEAQCITVAGLLLFFSWAFAGFSVIACALGV